jgi:hypothetical protein
MGPKIRTILIFLGHVRGLQEYILLQSTSLWCLDQKPCGPLQQFMSCLSVCPHPVVITQLPPARQRVIPEKWHVGFIAKNLSSRSNARSYSLTNSLHFNLDEGTLRPFFGLPPVAYTVSLKS